MRICIIAKFPPLQGGVSARTYWLASSLAKRGHDICVVTDATSAEKHEKVNGTLAELWAQLPANLKVVFSEPMNRSYQHHPMARPAVSQLSSLALREIEANGCDVIYSAYIEPYGIAGTLVSKLSGVPHVLSHAGSDVGRLMATRDLQHLFLQVLKQSTVLSATTEAARLAACGVEPDRIKLMPRPAPAWFDPDTSREDRTRQVPALLIGKLGRERDVKEWVKDTGDNGIELHVVGQPAYPKSKHMRDVVEMLARADHVDWKGYVWPWQVPRLLARTSILVDASSSMKEIETHVGGLPLEGFAAGCAVSMSRKVAGYYQVPDNTYITTRDEAIRLLTSADDHLRELQERGRLWLTKSLEMRDDIVPFEKYAEAVEQILQDPRSISHRTKITNAMSRYISLPREGAESPVKDEDQLWACKPVSAVRDTGVRMKNWRDLYVLRRLPLKAFPTPAGQWHLLAQSASLQRKEFLLSNLALKLLTLADEERTAGEILTSLRLAITDESFEILSSFRSIGLLAFQESPHPCEQSHKLEIQEESLSV